MFYGHPVEFRDWVDGAMEFGGVESQMEIWDAERSVETERHWDIVKEEIANEVHGLNRAVHRTWFEISAGLAVEGDTMLIGLLTLYTADHFRRSYDGARFVWQCVEMVAGRAMDWKVYALSGDRLEIRLVKPTTWLREAHGLSNENGDGDNLRDKAHELAKVNGGEFSHD